MRRGQNAERKVCYFDVESVSTSMPPLQRQTSDEERPAKQYNQVADREVLSLHIKIGLDHLKVLT